MKKILIYPLTAILLLLTVVSCQKDTDNQPTSITTKNADSYDATIAHQWMDMFRELTKSATGFTPPVAARAFGYAGLTMYETVVPGMPQYQSLKGQLSQKFDVGTIDAAQEYNWAIALNAAMSYTARSFYTTISSELAYDIINLENTNLEKLKVGVNVSVVDRSKAWGQQVAKAIFEWSKTDGGHAGYSNNFPSSYIPPVGRGLWQPTYPAYQPALQPYWGNNRTFMPNAAEYTQPDAPLPYSEDPNLPFFQAALEVYHTVNNITPVQKTIAEYWSDDPGVPGTPPGHLLSITTQVLQKEKYDLAKAALTYIKICMGLSDAFVSCWKCKYRYNVIRPITILRAKMDQNWKSLLTTPPFPEFTSGHSVASGAVAKILTDIFGTNYEITDKTHIKRTDINGTPRSFKSFNDMAAEAAISRLYGGIHFREAIEKGVIQGTRVGSEINKLQFKK